MSAKQFPARPSHLFLSDSSGDLFDTRRDNWSLRPPLRRRYSYAPREIRTVADLKGAMRAGPFAWPGGYEFIYATADSAALSWQAVRDNFREIVRAIQTDDSRSGWRVNGLFTTAECDMESVYCDHTGREIYAAPAADETENEESTS